MKKIFISSIVAAALCSAAFGDVTRAAMPEYSIDFTQEQINTADFDFSSISLPTKPTLTGTDADQFDTTTFWEGKKTGASDVEIERYTRIITNLGVVAGFNQDDLTTLKTYEKGKNNESFLNDLAGANVGTSGVTELENKGTPASITADNINTFVSNVNNAFSKLKETEFNKIAYGEGGSKDNIQGGYIKAYQTVKSIKDDLNSLATNGVAHITIPLKPLGNFDKTFTGDYEFSESNITNFKPDGTGDTTIESLQQALATAKQTYLEKVGDDAQELKNYKKAAAQLALAQQIKDAYDSLNSITLETGVGTTMADTDLGTFIDVKIDDIKTSINNVNESAEINSSLETASTSLGNYQTKITDTNTLKNNIDTNAEKAKDYIAAQDVESSVSAATENVKKVAQAYLDLDKDIKATKEYISSTDATPAEKEKVKGEIKEALGEVVKDAQITNSTSFAELTDAIRDAGLLADPSQKISDIKKADLEKTNTEAVKQIQTAVDKIATEVVESKKETITQEALGTLNIQINNMNKRLGEVRGLGGDTGVWLRGYGGRFSSDNGHYNYYSTQIGADKTTAIDGGDLIAGVLLGFDKVNAKTKTKAFHVGAYASFIDTDGAFADIVAKYARSSHKQAGWEYRKQNLFLLSAEGGYRFDAGEQAYIEPSLELITGYVGKYEAKTASSTISVKSFMPIVFKPQVFVGANVDEFGFRAGIGAVLNAKKNDAHIAINNLVGDFDANGKVRLDRNNHGFVSVGGSYKASENLRLNLSAEKSFGSKLKQDYELNATVRYTF